MDNEQRSELESLDRIDKFNDEHADVLHAVDDYPPLKTALKTVITKIKEAAANQQADSGVSKQLVADRKTTMANAVVLLAMRATVKARQNGNAELANQLDKPVGYVKNMIKTEAVRRALELRQLMNDNLDTLTSITPADIAAADTAIGAYTDVMNKPIIDKQHRKSHGTDPLPALFKQAGELVDSMHKLVVSYFAQSDPRLVYEFELAMKIINTGIRHNVVELTVLDAGTGLPIEAATVKSTNKAKAAITDYQGIATIGKHRNGHFNFTISANGYAPQTLGLDIRKGEKNVFEVRLESE